MLNPGVAEKLLFKTGEHQLYTVGRDGWMDESGL